MKAHLDFSGSTRKRAHKQQYTLIVTFEFVASNRLAGFTSSNWAAAHSKTKKNKQKFVEKFQRLT